MQIMLNRRQFLGTAAGAFLSRVDAQSTSVWGGPVLDIHLHPRREEGGELNHVNGSGGTKAILLTGSAMADHSEPVLPSNPGRFACFTASNMPKPDAIGVLRTDLRARPNR